MGSAFNSDDFNDDALLLVSGEFAVVVGLCQFFAW